MLLSNSDDEGNQTVNLAMNSTFPFKSTSSFVLASFAQALLANKPSFYKAWYMGIPKKIILSKKPLVYPTSTTTNIHMLDALKITKCRRRFVSSFTNIDFDNLVIENVNFVLPPIDHGDPDVYGKAMDGMDKI